MTRTKFWILMILAGLGEASSLPKLSERQDVPPIIPGFNGTGGPTMLRFGCHQLVIDRLDPLVNPGAIPSPHQHQIVGGNAFNASMPHEDITPLSTCTSCGYSLDFSNYWTSNLYFRARNGSYKRVPQGSNRGDFFGDEFSPRTNGGLTAYYVSPGAHQVKAFEPGFRMFFGDATLRSQPAVNLSTQTCFRCFNAPNFGGDETRPCDDPRVDTWHLPQVPCPGGIRSNILFPTCWDGKRLDSPDHKAHVAYPVEGPHIFDANGTAERCPCSHPVKIPQVMLEVIWNTTEFNDPDLWPEDGSQPFVLSTGDTTGYSQHADYVFGWQGDELQKGMDANCIADKCPGLAIQSVEEAAACAVPRLVDEEFDGWIDVLPGNPPGTPAQVPAMS